MIPSTQSLIPESSDPEPPTLDMRQRAGVSVDYPVARSAPMVKVMDVDGVSYHTIRLADDGWAVEVIDQTRLPHILDIVRLESSGDAQRAIADMIVRGAPLIGAAGAYGMALATREDASDAGLAAAAQRITAARPTAVNLKRAVERVMAAVRRLPPGARLEAAYAEARRICQDEAAACEAIGEHGARLIRAAWNGRDPVQVLTHCNAGWLASVDWGMSTSPVYKAMAQGVPVHVWVDETRPRNQGSALTAWELALHGAPHTIIVDNAGGHLMQHGKVDLCIVGSDRVAANGDVCNKIGTYLKALAAHDNGVPFYAALPTSTIDWSLDDGRQIPIEERSEGEVTHVSGLSEEGVLRRVRVTPEGSRAANYGFDVTPARLITGIITERGLCEASRAGLGGLREAAE
jgi:methylthioribose-1-phosphate isomerase